MKRFLLILAVSLCGWAASAVATPAALARVPAGFFGVVATPDLTDGPIFNLIGQAQQMKAHGVQSMRANFDWEVVQPRRGQYDWDSTDEVVTAAAFAHLQLLPVVEFTPQWASSHPSSAWDEYAPKSPSLYANFVTQLVKRYGPKGTFWKQHPGLAVDPVRSWQIWNEPEGTNYDWRSAPWPKTYTALLKAAYIAIHHADHGANVVTGALVSLDCRGCVQWEEASSLYRAGAGRYFDTMAVNAFTFAPTVQNSVAQSILILDRVRKVMNAHHDARKPIWVTEVTWTAALHKIPKREYDGFETTASGQKARLTAYYTRLAGQRPDGVAKAFWYDWESPYVTYYAQDTNISFQYCGLLKSHPNGTYTATPLLSAYTKLARRFER